MKKVLSAAAAILLALSLGGCVCAPWWCGPGGGPGGGGGHGGGGGWGDGGRGGPR